MLRAYLFYLEGSHALHDLPDDRLRVVTLYDDNGPQNFDIRSDQYYITLVITIWRLPSTSCNMCLRRLVCKLRMETPDVTIKFLMFSKVGELSAIDHVQLYKSST